MDFPTLWDLLYKLFLAMALGSLMGIEREKYKQEHPGADFAGVRTFILITFFGTLSAFLASVYSDWILALAFLGFILLILCAYILSSIYNKDTGMTTDISAIIAFLIGILVYITRQEIPILVAIIITLVLSVKEGLHKFVYNLKTREFFDTLKFVLIAFVILPLLKNIEPFGPFQSINLYEIWIMVVFVSGLSYIGYILMKTFGSHSGTIITGLLGGILSSTAVVTSLASKSKEEHKEIMPLVAASAIACATMFIRVLIEVMILNFSLISKLAFPMLILATIGYISVSILWKKKPDHATILDISSPMKLEPALKFGVFYGLILFLSNLTKYYFGSKGILLTAFISGLADVDAITIFVARNSTIELSIGIIAIVLAASVNTVIKTIVARIFGTEEYGTALLKSLMPTIITGLILLFFI